MASVLPEELSFLLPFFHGDAPRYRTAHWLACAFDDPVWKVRSYCTFDIDWRVRVGNEGKLLTAPYFAALLETFRSWLIVQTHVDLTGGRVHSPRTEHTRLKDVLAWQDYLLLNADHLGLPSGGLLQISDNNILAALATVTSSPSVHTSIYQWPERLARYLRSTPLDEDEISAVIREAPFIARDIPPIEDRLTDLDDDEILNARAWLWINGLYKGAPAYSGFRFSPKTIELDAAIYSDILRRGRRPIPVELCLVPGHRVNREYPSARIYSSQDARVSCSVLERYRFALHSLGALKSQKLPVPDMKVTDAKNVHALLSLKRNGRFRTLPYDIVFFALRRAIEFALEFGEDIVNSFLRVAKVAKNSNTKVLKYCESHDISIALTPKLAEMGVRAWTIEPSYAGSGLWDDAPKTLSSPEFYRQLRNNVGLFELLRVLIGAIATAVGALMARRQCELGDLVAGSCLDKTRTYLVFGNAKSGVMGLREQINRPIPPVAAELIGILEKLQFGLIEAGLLDAPTALFAHPSYLGEPTLVALYNMQYNESLDYFCDYIQVPLNQLGQRYYIRQHQLRRFFAILFFWGGGLEHLDTLRWFLGHTDSAHLYRYITEQIPGALLRGVQAQWASESLKKGWSETQALAEFLQQRYGTSNFTLLDSDALTVYIEDLIDEGLVRVEPEFLDDGRTYRILVKITPIKERRQNVA